MEAQRKAVEARIVEVRAMQRRQRMLGSVIGVALFALFIVNLVVTGGQGSDRVLVFLLPFMFFLGALDLFRTEQLKDLLLFARSVGSGKE